MTPFFEISVQFAVDLYIEFVDSVNISKIEYTRNLTPKGCQISTDPIFTIYFEFAAD